MSYAWEVTIEDIQLAVFNHKGRMLSEQQAEEIKSKLDLGAVEKAALRGDDIEEQTEYAAQEIWKQVKEKTTIR